jgi:hypothetical protein
MTLSRIHNLESLGFEWGNHGAAWGDRLSELADYRKIHGHCNVPHHYSENSRLGYWVARQRKQYKLHLEGKTSQMTPFPIQELVSLGFEWECSSTWGDRLSELANYRKIHGHCNVPHNYSENSRLAKWVSKQRSNYRLRVEGTTSSMTTFRIQELESLGFEWDYSGATWGDRLSELAAYRKIQGHCNDPRNSSDNFKLANWVRKQRYLYKQQLEGKTSFMTLSHIQELESLAFEWGSASPPGRTV